MSIPGATGSVANDDSSTAAAHEELLKHLEITEDGSGEVKREAARLRVRAKAATSGMLTLDLPVRYR